MGDGLQDHPGFLGLTSRGVIALHADWPAYPVEHGVDVALASLGRLPVGTAFVPIDDIDRCVLLARVPAPTDPFDPSGFHVAVWHEDLVGLATHGWVSGVSATTQRAWEEARRDRIREELRALGTRHDDPLDHLFVDTPSRGTAHMWLPDIAQFDDELKDHPAFNEYVTITSAGWGHLESILSASLELPDDLAPRIEVLIDAGLFDAAIRDVGIALETQMRLRTGSGRFGLGLVEEFVNSLAVADRYTGAYVKLVRAELRTAMKFVRNEFAHNLLDLDAVQGKAILGRMTWVYTLISQ